MLFAKMQKVFLFNQFIFKYHISGSLLIAESICFLRFNAEIKLSVNYK